MEFRLYYSLGVCILMAMVPSDTYYVCQLVNRLSHFISPLRCVVTYRNPLIWRHVFYAEFWVLKSKTCHLSISYSFYPLFEDTRLFSKTEHQNIPIFSPKLLLEIVLIITLYTSQLHVYTVRTNNTDRALKTYQKSAFHSLFYWLWKSCYKTRVLKWRDYGT